MALSMSGQARVISSARSMSIAPRLGFVHCQPHFLGNLHRQVNPSHRCKIPFPGAIHAHKNHDDDHHHHHHCDHHQHGGHSHTHPDLQDEQGLNALQLGVVRLGKLTGLAYIADAWRDSVHLCCASIGLLLLGLVCPKLLPPSRGLPLQTTLAVAAFSLTGVPAVVDATVDVAGGKVNMHVLMALAAFASVFMGNAMEGALLLAMFSLSHQAEEYFTNKAMGDVKALRKSNPEFALVLQESDAFSHPNLAAVPVKQVDVAKVEVGSFLLVKAGEGVPVDAEVCQGRSTVTLEHLTGEAHPLEKKVGDSVPGGARNLDGMLVVKATKTWKESTLARIMTLTEEAQANKPKLQRWLDDFGEKYSKAVVAVSALVALLGPAVFKWPLFSHAGVRGSLYRALGLMVAASPCALAVAPLAYATAISSCASKGILLKGGEVFDALARCDTIAFDKTGTLTTGELKCKAIEPIHGHSPSSELAAAGDSSCCHPTCEAEALAVAAALERGATHPIARAVVQHSEGKELPTILVDNFESRPGQGLLATVTNHKSGDHRALIGSLDYIASASSVPESQQLRAAAEHSIHGNDLVHAALAVDDKVTLFHFEDKIRKGAADVLKSLKDEARLRLLMLTGDHSPSAQRVADAVGIQEVHSELKPEDKLLQVRRLTQEAEGGLIMVGDGINDAPALAAATVGIVLAQFASATAIAVADVLLLNDRIEGVPFVISKSRQTMSLVKQNVALALCSIFVAAMSSVGGLLPLWITVLLHEGGTLLVCINSVRALNDPMWASQWRKDALGFASKCLQSLKDQSLKVAPVL